MPSTAVDITERKAKHAESYNRKFPDRPPLTYSHGMLTGCWMIGNCFQNPNPLHGAYPHGYLERVHAMFPDAMRILHAFSGGLTREQARAHTNNYYDCATGQVMRGFPAEVLVDMHGPSEGRHPTWQGDIHEFCDLHSGLKREPFDLILADPPYSKKDAEVYGCPPPNRGLIMQSLRRVARPGTNLVWLDQVWPMHRKTEWKTWGTIGLVRSTNHRVRLVSLFEAQGESDAN